MEPFRDLYEALVICSFLYYLVALLGGEEEMIATLERKQYYQRHQQNQQYEPLHHLDQEQQTTGHNSNSTTTLPMRKYLICQESETTTADEFVLQCKQGVLFFVTIKAIAAFLMALLKPLGLYGDETDGTHILDPTRAFLYTSTLLNVSMSYALYCLIKLFYAVKEELREPINWRPVRFILWYPCAVVWDGYIEVCHHSSSHKFCFAHIKITPYEPKDWEVFVYKRYAEYCKQVFQHIYVYTLI